ncbi:hypothetical protein [Roseibacillus ishigakijimensis]|uniref:Uncharacterized protein n=1 Tax=Roseibacillus ishigakijimensis TaxID=454146 RepID=A0A934RPE7_9BACT|nr:hypothetical protein [Roseibacillus ishigakijimensis]MBK1835079.1 hypothetical protein [Roseibacillus ishigakijimensis]
MKRPLIILAQLAFFALAGGAAWAQEEAARKITYRITGFGSGVQSLANQPGGESFQFSDRNVSNPLEANLRDQLFLDFYGEGAAAGEAPLFSVKVPAGTKEALVLVSRQGEDLAGKVLDLQALGLQGGGQYFFNMLSVPIMVECGEGARPVVIGPGGQEKVDPPGDDKVLQTLSYADDKQRKVKFSSSVYFKDSTARKLVFCVAEKGARLPKAIPIAIYDREENS